MYDRTTKIYQSVRNGQCVMIEHEGLERITNVEEYPNTYLYRDYFRGKPIQPHFIFLEGNEVDPIMVSSDSESEFEPTPMSESEDE